MDNTTNNNYSVTSLFTSDQIKKINDIFQKQKINIDIVNPKYLDKKLVDFGIDSLSVLPLILDIEKEFNIHLDDDKLANITDLRSLLDLIYDTIHHKQ